VAAQPGSCRLAQDVRGAVGPGLKKVNFPFWVHSFIPISDLSPIESGFRFGVMSITVTEKDFGKPPLSADSMIH